jgi:RNA polymerase-associated protein
MTTQSKRSTMTLYADSQCPYCHRVKIILASKGIVADIIEINSNDEKPEELYELNPYGQVPTLMGRDIIVYESEIIFEYLEERYPYPPLLSVFPTERAQTRLLSRRIDRDWMPLLVQALRGEENVQYHSKVALVKELLSVVPVFNRFKYFMSNEFSILDVSLGIILYRLPELGIQLPPRAKAMDNYAKRIFAMDSFQESLNM